MRAHGHVGMFAVLVVYLDTVCHCVLISAPIVDAAAAGANTENKVLATPFRKVMFPLTDNDCTYVCIFHRAVGRSALLACISYRIHRSLSLSLSHPISSIHPFFSASLSNSGFLVLSNLLHKFSMLSHIYVPQLVLCSSKELNTIQPTIYLAQGNHLLSKLPPRAEAARK